ncbi:lipocalin/fatty acid-binding family protein [Helicobacter pylori]|uniref:hypothetical protein n=1 Tax=Helicobacter pylori TaxID=210 RepID=UPI000EB100FF|nr:hypothetical protein [Helicobacter pylori]BDO46371.1 hypothetical protein CHC155_08640 [Helicobacter pylori]GHQ44049.1 hypothetical protein VN0361_05900 [Helicobacter pylori]GHR48843.1 hypothetical protein VN1262_13460 [Helicobacter pylori]GHS23492.1 hypothetical protein VN1289_07950 [Helicobacter pylori]
MEENRDGHAIVSNVIKSLEKGGSFSPSDRAKFAQTAREHGIEGSVIEEVIDIGQILSLIYPHEDRIDRSDLAREEKKAVHAELQKSIDENLEALRKITNSLFAAKFVADLTRSMFPLNVQKMMEVLNNYNNKDGSK